jgi:hypothetical protein
MRLSPAPRLCFCSIATLLLTLMPAPNANAQIAPGPQGPPHSGKPPLPADQEQFIAYWTLEAGWGSELQLRNNVVGADLTVIPALRSADGVETALAPVTIHPQEIKIVDLESAVLALAPQYLGTYGSIVLRYHSTGNRNLFAMLMIHDRGHSIAFHIDATGEDQDLAPASREGVWWLPNDAATDHLVVTNQSARELQADLSLYDSTGREAKQKLTLPPRATIRLSVRQLVRASGLSGTFGGVRIFAPSHGGSLDSVHLLFDETSSFSAFLKMFNHSPKTTLDERDFAHTKTWTLRAPMLALSQPDPALAFPEGTVLHPQLFVHNTIAKSVDVTLRFAWRSASAKGKAAGPSFRLGGFETHQVDVAALQASEVLPKDAAWTSVILTTNGLPEEVVALAASYDKTLRYGAQTPFSDQLAFEWVGSLWEYDVQHNSLITAGNGGSKPVQAGFTIYYNGGTQKYELEQSLQPDEQMWIDVGKLIREQVPDKNGKLLPQDLTSGSYQLRDLSDKFIGSLYEGKVVYDKTFGHVTYGCAGCCAYSLTQLSFNPLGIPLLSTSANGVDAYNTCSSWWESVDESFYGHWSTASTTIATVNYYATHTGKAVGSTTSSTSGYLLHPTPRTCSNVLRSLQGSDNVASVKILLGGSGGTDITGKTQSVVVGQQIVLYADYTLPSGVTASSQSWSVPGGTIVASYTASASSGSLNTNVTLNQQSTTFYWVFASSSQVTFTLNYGNGQTATAQATFNIGAPSPATPTVTLPTNGKLHIDTLTGCAGNPSSPYLVFGDISGPVVGCPGTYTGNPGIAFSPPTTATPTGAFFFVQLVTGDYLNYNSLTCTATPGLDGAYPYQSKTGQAVNDAPFAPLPSVYTSLTRSFGATMYLMWQSSTHGSIPVPIGSVPWSFSSTTSQSGGVWSTPNNGGTAGAFAVAYTTSGYPTWTGLAVPANQNCH